MKSHNSHDVSDNDSLNEDEPSKQSTCSKSKKFKFLSMKPYRSPLHFQKSCAKTILDAQSRKFLDVHKKMYVNIPFIDTLSQIRMYAKYLKEFFSKKY